MATQKEGRLIMFYYLFVLFQHLVENREKGREKEKRQEPQNLEILVLEVLELKSFYPTRERLCSSWLIFDSTRLWSTQRLPEDS
jgi:hypothetical protein